MRAAGADRPRTLLIIAHRLSTVMECDAVMVLAGGRLVESGAPAVLAAKGEASAFGRLVGAAARAIRPGSSSRAVTRTKSKGRFRDLAAS